MAKQNTAKDKFYDSTPLPGSSQESEPLSNVQNMQNAPEKATADLNQARDGIEVMVEYPDDFYPDDKEIDPEHSDTHMSQDFASSDNSEGQTSPTSSSSQTSSSEDSEHDHRRKRRDRSK